MFYCHALTLLPAPRLCFLLPAENELCQPNTPSAPGGGPQQFIGVSAIAAMEVEAIKGTLSTPQIRVGIIVFSFPCPFHNIKPYPSESNSPGTRMCFAVDSPSYCFSRTACREAFVMGLVEEEQTADGDGHGATPVRAKERTRCTRRQFRRRPLCQTHSLGQKAPETRKLGAGLPFGKVSSVDKGLSPEERRDLWSSWAPQRSCSWSCLWPGAGQARLGQGNRHSATPLSLCHLHSEGGLGF